MLVPDVLDVSLPSCIMAASLLKLFICFLVAVLHSKSAAQKTQLRTTYTGECLNNLETRKYGYMNFYHVSDAGTQHNVNKTFILTFLVQASSNAHILLAQNPAPTLTDAVYEIVLGAGKNTFSDIRRSQKTSSKMTVATRDILSSTEYRAFWISTSKDGFLEVGKWGEDTPFLFWQDTAPLSVKYFSFSTWTDVWGKWQFNCNENNKTGQGSREEIEEVSRPLTTREKLRRDLLETYDPYVRPVLEVDHLTTVLMDFKSQHIVLDEKRSLLKMQGELSMSWIDEKIRWEPRDYDNLTRLTILHRELWQPEIILYNAANNGKKLLGLGGLVVTSGGGVVWKATAQIESWCTMDLSRWPNDRQTCDIQLGLYSQERLLELAVVTNKTQMNEQRTGSEWDFVDLLSETTWSQSPWTDLEPDSGTEMPFSALTLKLTLQRNNKAYHHVLRVPLIVISIISLVSFWMTPLKSGKLTLLCLDLVLLTMFFLAIGSALPAPADHIPNILIAYSIGMVALTVAILLTILLITVARYDHLKVPSKRIYNLIYSQPLQTFLCLPQIRKVYRKLEDVPENEINSANYVKECWIRMCLATDRVAFMMYVVVWGIILAVYN